MPSLQLDLGGGQFICSTEGKGPHEVLGYCKQHYLFLEVVTVLILIHTFHSLSGVIVYTNNDEDKSTFIFLMGAGISEWTSNYSELYFFEFIHAHAISFLKNEIIYVFLEYRVCYE